MPALALAISLIVLSHSGIFIRFARADALAIGFWRMAFVVPFLFLLLQQQRQWPLVSNLRRAQWGGLFLCGLCLFSHWWTWFLAVQKTSLANSMVLFAISPVFTAAGAWVFFREKITARHLAALLCCFVGVVVLFQGSLSLQPENFTGDLLGLISSVFFSAYVLASKGVRDRLGNLPFTFVTYSFCGALFLVTMQAFALPLYGYDAQTWGAFAALAVGPTLLGHALFTYCMQFFSVNMLNILLLTEPVIASTSAYFILYEPITFPQALGFFAIACGVLVLFVPGKKAR